MQGLQRREINFLWGRRWQQQLQWHPTQPSHWRTHSSWNLRILVRFYGALACVICTDPITNPFLVPIYDCHNQRFRFDEDALNTVTSLPLFEGDLPTGAIVSVAYAANSMPYAPSMNAPKVDLGIFFNILFVLFLAELPEESEGGLEEEGWTISVVHS